MAPADIQAQMRELEEHGQNWSVEQFIEWLLGIQDAAAAVMEESDRAAELAEGHYQRVTGRVGVLNPRMIAQVGFIQGVTFAAAALGVQPFRPEADRKSE